jgi:hypothetical protein
MKDKKADAKRVKELTRENLIWSALEDKLNAIGGYDAIIWKIRTGYVAVLYGALTLLVGTGGASGIAVITSDFLHSVSIFLLIVGFGVTAFIIDFSYVRKKLRVIVARDALIDIALQSDAEDEEELDILLHVAGETFVKLLPGEAQRDYRAKRNWNLIWILGPLYATTPTIAVIIYLISRAQ